MLTFRVVFQGMPLAGFRWNEMLGPEFGCHTALNEGFIDMEGVCLIICCSKSARVIIHATFFIQVCLNISCLRQEKRTEKEAPGGCVQGPRAQHAIRDARRAMNLRCIPASDGGSGRGQLMAEECATRKYPFGQLR